MTVAERHRGRDPRRGSGRPRRRGARAWSPTSPTLLQIQPFAGPREGGARGWVHVDVDVPPGTVSLADVAGEPLLVAALGGRRLTGRPADLVAYRARLSDLRRRPLPAAGSPPTCSPAPTAAPRYDLRLAGRSADGTGRPRTWCRSPAARTEPAGAVPRRAGADMSPAARRRPRRPAPADRPRHPAAAEPPPEERCEMCGVAIAERARPRRGHPGPPAALRLPPLLPAVQRRRGRWRPLPWRGRRPSASSTTWSSTEADWAALQIPVELAFFLSQGDPPTYAAFYPGPSGATESTLDLARVAATSSPPTPPWRPSSPTSRRYCCATTTPASRCYVTPVDVCYELVGIVRAHWVGLAGGAEVWARIDAFFDGLARRERPDQPGGLRWPSSTSACGVASRPTATPPPRRSPSGCTRPGPRASACTPPRSAARCGSSRVRRRYDDARGGQRWTACSANGSAGGSTMQPLQLAFLTQLLPGFTGATDFDLPCRAATTSTSRRTATSTRWSTARCRCSCSSAARSSPVRRVRSGSRRCRGTRRPGSGCRCASGGRRWTCTSRARRGCAWTGTPSTGSRRTAPAHQLVGLGGHRRAAPQGGRRMTAPGLDDARAVADAVLYEGYVLYPYRASSAKNQVRFQWGVLMPADVVAARPVGAQVEPDLPWSSTARAARLRVLVRCLQVQRRGSRRGPATASSTVAAPRDARHDATCPGTRPSRPETTLDVPLDRGHLRRTTGRCRAARTARTCATRQAVSWAGWCAPASRSGSRSPSRSSARPRRTASRWSRIEVGQHAPPTAETPAPTRPDWLRRAAVAAHLLLRVEDGRVRLAARPAPVGAGVRRGLRATTAPSRS